MLHVKELFCAKVQAWKLHLIFNVSTEMVLVHQHGVCASIRIKTSIDDLIGYGENGTFSCA